MRRNEQGCGGVREKVVKEEPRKMRSVGGRGKLEREKVRVGSQVMKGNRGEGRGQLVVMRAALKLAVQNLAVNKA